MSDSIAPITHEYDLPRSAEHVFETYADRIGEWWDPRYTANAEIFETVTIEPRVGVRVCATHSDLGKDHWGDVTVWEPGRRLVHTFTLAQDSTHPSQVAVEFSAHGDGCTMRFAHGGWNRGKRGREAEVRRLARYARQVRCACPGVIGSNRG